MPGFLPASIRGRADRPCRSTYRRSAAYRLPKIKSAVSMNRSSQTIGLLPFLRTRGNISPVLSFVRYVNHDDHKGLQIPLDEREYLYRRRQIGIPACMTTALRKPMPLFFPGAWAGFSRRWAPCRIRRSGPRSRPRWKARRYSWRCSCSLFPQPPRWPSSQPSRNPAWHGIPRG